MDVLDTLPILLHLEQLPHKLKDVDEDTFTLDLLLQLSSRDMYGVSLKGQERPLKDLIDAFSDIRDDRSNLLNEQVEVLGVHAKMVDDQ